jgi:hypothetical protein
MPDWYVTLQEHATVLFASVLLVMVVFLIARIGKISQPTALALALSPVLFALAFDKASLPVLF